MPYPSPQRDLALDTVRQLRTAGFESLLAGGCVRDELLGIAPKDYDVATNATPDQIRGLFGRRRTLPIGAAFGVVTLLGPHGAGQIDVATFRSDATYSDGRHPDSVTFTTAERDAQRRDFTINGLFCDPLSGQIVDYVGGRDDLDRHIIRAIGDPRLRFGEDKLRLLRAVRFAAAFDFMIEPATLQAIQEMAPGINEVSSERIGMEIRRMLTGPHRAVALRLLRESKLLPYVFPEVSALPDNAFDETTRILDALDGPSLPLALAAVLNTEHGARSTEKEFPLPAHSVGRRLRYTNKEIERTTWLLDHLPGVQDAHHLPWPQLQRVLIHDGAQELIALATAISDEDSPALLLCRERLAWPVDRLNPPPLVDGAALIERGHRPGPQFSELLDRIRDAQLNGEIHTRDAALALADQLFPREPS